MEPMSEFTLRLRRYDPESGDAALLGRAHDRARAAPLGARGRSSRPRGASTARSGSAAPAARRSAAPAACASTASPGSPATPTSTRRSQRSRRRRDRGRADGQHAGDQGPDRRHGRRALEEDPVGHAVAARPASRCPSASTSSTARRWSTSRSRWPASSAAPASRTAWRWRSTPTSPARPRSPRPTASSATRATPSTRERLDRARRGPARPLHLHALLQVRRRLPEGRQPDGADHAPAPHRRLRPPHRGPQQRLPPRARVRQEHPPQRPAARGRPAARTPTAASSTRARCPS